MNRRDFIQKSALAAAGVYLTGCQAAAKSRKISPNEKLNVAVIGVANQGRFNLDNVASQNIVALCDIDDNFLHGAAQRFPQAKTYNDYRKLLDQKDIDAVVVATPDHTHAVISVAALKSGRHVYCEKPLARTIAEARIVTETARKQKRVTQIGTQIHAGKNYRRVVELVQSGAIGTVKEVHVWVGGGYGNKELPKEHPPVPPNVHYDLWLGPVEYRPYSPEYLPFNWRHWWAFGGGTLADLGCHHIDLSHWALDLRAPVSVEAEGPAPHPESAPHWLIVRYEYPARGAQPPVNLTWYHGDKRPHYFAEGKLPKWGNGTLFVGSDGMLLADYDKHVLIPDKKVQPTIHIPDSIGHHNEWILACKTGGKTTCNFDYSGPLTEAVLLGNVAFRTGKKLYWDSAKMKVTNSSDADQYIYHHYRKGWKI